jgi:pseudomonalisin
MQVLRSSICFLTLFILASSAHAQVLRNDRVTAPIDDRNTVLTRGDRHPLALSQYDAGPAASSERLEHMILVLSPDPAQQQALEQLLRSQQDRESPLYHQWLTPESFGQQFGISDSDLSQISNWLTGHGFQVDELVAGRRAIVFSGTVGQVETAFHTQMRHYNVNGQRHLANSTSPAIPTALARVVQGVSSLHDFRKRPMHSLPEFTSGGAHYLAPADFATIYDVGSLYSASFDGTGQSIAIVGRTNIALSDVTTFRTTMGLPANNPAVVINGTNPGIVSSDEETEALLDVEWSGAVARKAAVQLVVSASTNSTDGVDLSAQYIVSHNLAPVMSTSFGSCEADMGPSENAFWNSLWAQAASQGITAFVSAGDSGAAGCDAPSSTRGTVAAVSGLCSTPYNVCVGGTEFNDTANASQYWSPNNSSTSLASALSYIPENPWNESGTVSGGSDLWATGGGASGIYAKPSWQAGRGVPSDGRRDVPDVSLSAAGHDAYLIVMNGQLGAVGGTSASSPSFAGLMALILQKTNARQGNPNPTFYSLATQQSAGGAAVFHDITSGNNSVPGVTGFTAAAGYDPVTGLGSVDALQLANHWQDTVSTPTPKFAITASPTALTLAPGSHGAATITSTLSNGFNAAVALSVAGLPSGVTASLSPASFAAPGSGVSTLTLTAAAGAASGTFPVTVTGLGNASTAAATVTLTVSGTVHTAPSLTLGLSATASSIAQGGSAAVTVSVSGNPGAAVALSVSNLPAGVTASFAPASLPSPGTGGSTLTFKVSASAPLGTTRVAVTASGGGITTTQIFSLTVARPFSATISASAASVKAGSSVNAATLVVDIASGFTAPVTLSATGLPAGVTCTFTPASLSGAGNQSSTVKFTAASTAAAGRSTITLAVSGGGLTLVGSFSLTVTK